MARKPPPPREANIVLGKKLEQLRKLKGLSPMQLGRMINETEQQVKRFEAGALVPLPTLERIADELGESIPKRTIRRISSARKIEFERGEPSEELLELYQGLFEEEG